MNCKTKGRDKYLGIDSAKNDCARRDFTVEQAEKCIAEGWMDPEDTQNSSPTAGEIVKFCKANPAFIMHGYVVSPHRDDTRVSLEGVRAVKKPTAKQVKAFAEMFRCADDFTLAPDYYAWYD
jgi:hypothetical protein